MFFSVSTVYAAFEKDTIQTSRGDLVITFIGHGTLHFQYQDVTIHVDPVTRYANYTEMPDADIILITHHHGDHLDPEAIDKISTKNTKIIYTQTCAKELAGGSVLNNGEHTTIRKIPVKAVPAYNLVHKRGNGEPYHPKGVGNGYVISFGDIKVYVAGDTENVPEMADLTEIDIAFLPMNLPYTMTPKMVVDAVTMFQPKILYPYHYGNTDVSELVKLLRDYENTEVRVRSMD
ncbi:MAG: MBL fold metallo-hydrolase [Candidatus Marinimicrobia bacterium]|nr:MBL fold metallo-hydrolase [Candidatus Neomarinimicrobiota bacterium]MCF7827428.1 MBL fold metallo-hydrolase [Candidatus Neomarinimicrobiota bacterium]MCF7881339.1 MBL fold metallo-hydrolase [Candidatus Neomarinimicrobiota bacterium]